MRILRESHRFSKNLRESQRKVLYGMDVRAIKHAAKLSEWQERILACRSNGIPVKWWCEGNNISIKSYYRWERLYMVEASSRVGNAALMPESTGQLVRIDPDQLPDKKGMITPVTAEEATTQDRITLRYDCHEHGMQHATTSAQ